MHFLFQNTSFFDSFLAIVHTIMMKNGESGTIQAQFKETTFKNRFLSL